VPVARTVHHDSRGVGQQGCDDGLRLSRTGTPGQECTRRGSGQGEANSTVEAGRSVAPRDCRDDLGIRAHAEQRQSELVRVRLRVRVGVGVRVRVRVTVTVRDRVRVRVTCAVHEDHAVRISSFQITCELLLSSTVAVSSP